jgi:predicted secreted protein
MKRRTARVGQEFSVPLPAVGPTGHQWELQAGGENVEVVRREMSQPGSAVGAASAEQITLRPKKAGSYVLQFGLKRPWEAEIAETATVEVNVTGAKKAKAKAAPKKSPRAEKKAAKRAP